MVKYGFLEEFLERILAVFDDSLDFKVKQV